MEEREEKRGGWGCAIGFVLLLVLLPILYVLSSGPALALVFNGVVSADVFKVVYEPLFWETFPAFDNALAWYWKLWGESSA